jgi:hypothetical protein
MREKRKCEMVMKMAKRPKKTKGVPLRKSKYK